MSDEVPAGVSDAVAEAGEHGGRAPLRPHAEIADAAELAALGRHDDPATAAALAAVAVGGRRRT